MEKNQKQTLSPKLSKLKTNLQFSSSEKNSENSFLKKKYKCPELLRKKHKLNFNEGLPYHLKKKFTKNILLSEKKDKIILISKDEYIKANNKPIKEEKSTSNLLQMNSKNKIKDGEETKEENNLKDLLDEISEITADLELFEMERRKRKIMKLIELMAEQFDNNLINPDELLNLFILDEKNI